MLCNAIRRFWIFGVLLLMPLTSAAGVNTWTGGRPGGTAGDVPSVVAADPADPYVVYGALGADLEPRPRGVLEGSGGHPGTPLHGVRGGVRLDLQDRR